MKLNRYYNWKYTLKTNLGYYSASKSFYEPTDLEAELNCFKEVMVTISIEE